MRINATRTTKTLSPSSQVKDLKKAMESQSENIFATVGAFRRSGKLSIEFANFAASSFVDLCSEERGNPLV